ncbi:AMP-binding protein, partial [Desulfotomaculum copahuensis]|uniref:AMP-binding protein n=1 Tax=Desulfotomaculum copahuensis TaxID=1838280 RepID=UPI000B31B451
MEVHSILSRQLVIGEMLARQAGKNPNKTALVEDGRRLSYGGLNRRVNRLANALAGLSVGRGDRVAMMLFNCTGMVEGYFALAKLGAVAVPVNFRFVAREVADVLNHSESKAFIYDSVFHEMVDGIRERIPCVRHFIAVGGGDEEQYCDYEKLLASGNENEPVVPVDEDDPAYIMYTSGTTGRPKGAVLTHKNKFMNSVNCIIEIGLDTSDVYLCVPPLYHTAAMAVMLMMVFLGGTTVLVRQFDPAAVVETAAREKVTITFLVPAMWNALLRVSGAGEKMKTLRKAITGAAIMPASLKEAVLKALPNVGLFDAFGQTEMSPVTTMLKPEDALWGGPIC